MALLELRHISKTFNHEPAVDDVSLDLEEGNILCLLGPSGCGKTTLLRIIAGLERPDEGTVYFDGRDMARIEPHRRNFGMMFQEFALFPHKDVIGNITFGLRMQKRSRMEILKRSQEMLSLVGLEGYSGRNVSELSGGERQRVALARSLAPHPALVLLDEPLGSLDRALRERLILEVRNILKTLQVTTVFVTHDQTEAFAIGDIIAVMNKGTIEQIDSPEKLYAHPANANVARFLGFHNLVEGLTMTEGTIETALGILHAGDHRLPTRTKVTVLIRPDGARLRDESNPAHSGEAVVSGMVKDCLFKGRNYHIELQINNGQVLVFDLPNESRPVLSGRSIDLVLSPRACVIMPGI
jgi:ABC-type Fe3+/spermidine/putrescine transport system ATPase subunit